MAIGVITNESTVALVAEVTEGTYVAPSTGVDYVEVLADGLELNKTREELSRDTLGGTVESEASRVGIAEVQGSIPCEYKASATEGDAPQSLDILLRSLLGGKRQITADQTSDIATHTSTVIDFADTSAFSVGDIVLVKEAGAYECRPISSIQTNTSITFPFALDNGAPSSAVVVAQVTTYYHDTSNSITFSAEHNLGSQAIKQKVDGLRAVSGSIENMSVGQLPNFNFGVQGLNIVREDADATAAADFTADALPPVTLESCVWLGGNKMSYTELAVNIENTVSYIADACDADGRIGSRITEQVVTASFNPYLDDSDLTLVWDKFNNNTDASLFYYSFNPSTTTGEFGEVVAGWLPQCKILATPVSDNDGIVSESVEVKAHKSGVGSNSIFLGFI